MLLPPRNAIAMKQRPQRLEFLREEFRQGADAPRVAQFTVRQEPEITRQLVDRFADPGEPRVEVRWRLAKSTLHNEDTDAAD